MNPFEFIALSESLPDPGTTCGLGNLSNLDRWDVKNRWVEAAKQLEKAIKDYDKEYKEWGGIMACFKPKGDKSPDKISREKKLQKIIKHQIQLVLIDNEFKRRDSDNYTVPIFKGGRYKSDVRLNQYKEIMGDRKLGIANLDKVFDRA